MYSNQPMQDFPQTPTKSFMDLPSSPPSPADSGYGSGGSSPSSSPRSSRSSKKAKRPRETYKINRPEEFLPPANYQVPEPREAPRRSGSRIPRPPNAFLLFRSFLLNYKLRERDLQNKQQTTSIMAANIWRNLPDYVRKAWTAKSKEAVDLHSRLYPNYRFEPSRKASAKNSTAQQEAEAAYAREELSKVFGIGLAADSSSVGDDASGLPTPDPSQPQHDGAGVPTTQSTSSLYQPVVYPTMSTSSQSRSPLTMEMLQAACQQFSTQLEHIRSENAELKHRIIQFEATFAGAQSPDSAQGSPLAANVLSTDNGDVASNTTAMTLCGTNDYDSLVKLWTSLVDTSDTSKGALGSPSLFSFDGGSDGPSTPNYYTAQLE